MKFIFLITLSLSMIFNSYSQPKQCKIIVETKKIQRFKQPLFISLFKSNSEAGIELIKKIKIHGDPTTINVKAVEPLWGLVDLTIGDSTIASSSSFLMTNSVIKITFNSLTNPPTITGGENDFIFKHRFLLFDWPQILASYPGLKVKSLKENYEFIPTDIRLKLYWKEYENSLIEQISKKNNFYYVLESLNSIKGRLPLMTLEKCYSLLADTLKKTKKGIELKQYLEKTKRILLKEIAPAFNVWDEFGQAYPSSTIYSKSKYTLLDFWASWCLPCREKMQDFKAIYTTLDTSRFQIISISIDDKKDSWVKASNIDKIPWGNYIDTTGKSGHIAKTFSLDYIPKNVLIDSTGVIIGFDIWRPEFDFFLKDNKLIKK